MKRFIQLIMRFIKNLFSEEDEGYADDGYFSTRHEAPRKSAAYIPTDVTVAPDYATANNVARSTSTKPNAPKRATHVTGRPQQDAKTAFTLVPTTKSAKAFTALEGVETILIGRDAHCDVRPDSQAVSSMHAVILSDDQGGFILRDLRSSNGTYVNGREVSEEPLHSGDVIRFGGKDATYRIQLSTI